MNLRSNEALWRTIGVLLLGQAVSFLLSLFAFASSFVASRGVDTPLTLAFSNYLALALVFGGILLYRRQKLMVSWYWYALIGFMDVQGNYFNNKAFQYSSITSVTLLDCLTIAWVIALTWFVLGTRYSLWQFCGVAICVLGLGLNLLSDAGMGGEGASKPLLGDFLVIIATFFFAMSNVGEEFCVKKKDLVEVVAMIGVFGLLVTVCEIAILERQTLESVKWSGEIIFAFACYTLSSFIYYISVPYILKMSGATMFNLSILTSNMWAVVIRIFFYRQKVGLLYYVSFAIVVIGLVTYTKTEKDHIALPAPEDRHSNGQYQVLSEESVETGNETVAS